MFRLSILAVFMSFSVHVALAQSPPATAPAIPAASTASEAAKSVVLMEEAKPGDRWTYEVRDDITGDLKTTRTSVVTEVSPTEIATRLTTTENKSGSPMLFDRSWNVIQGGPWKHAPHDGTGVSLPLEIGKTWSFRSSDVNSVKGGSWKRTGTSKVVGREDVTTKAGTFDVFKIETSGTSQSANDPTRKIHVTQTTWYSPAINHWVKRTTTIRANQRLMDKSSIELVSYGRKS